MQGKAIPTPYILFSLLAVMLTGCTSPLPREAWSPEGITPAARDTVVVLYEDDAGLYYADAMVNGRGPYRLLLDTGAYGLFLADDVVRELNCPPVPRARVMARNTSGQTLPALHVVRLAEVRLGALCLSNLHASVHERTRLILPIATEYDGILGIGVFHDTLLILDIPQSVLQVVPGRLRGGAPFVTRTINRKRDVPRIVLTLQPIGDSPYRCGAVIDTGANVLELPDAARQWAIPRSFVRGARLHEVGGQLRQTARYRIRAQITLGDSQCQLTDPIVGFQGQTGRISTDVLGNTILIFDQKNGRMAFLPDDQRERLPALIQSASQNVSFSSSASASMSSLRTGMSMSH
jgi:hypothetical protein